MARKPVKPSPPVFHAPMRVDWTDERLKALSQEQLLRLLDNLDQQRQIGRVSEDDAGAVEPRIVALLTTRNRTKRHKQLHSDGGIAVASE